MLQADPWIIDAQINVSRNRPDDYKVLLDQLTGLLWLCQAPECYAYVLIIPHAVQVDPFYHDAMQILGAKFAESQKLDDENYPFLQGIENRLHEQGIRHVQVLNPLVYLQESERQGNPVYHSNDSHLNPYGQQLIARFIIEKIGF
jgi:hypothetical protein